MKSRQVLRRFATIKEHTTNKRKIKFRNSLLWGVSVIIFSSTPGYATGLFAKVDKCETGSEFALPLGIATSLVTSVANTLVGSALTATVNYLNTKRATTFSAAVPIENGASIAASNSGQCLYVSSTPIDKLSYEDLQDAWQNSDFFAVFSFRASSIKGPEVIKPVVEKWTYRNFLNRSCPLLRNCSRRDVLLTLSFVEPAAPGKPGKILSEPIGAAWPNIQRRALQNALMQNSELPWVQAESLTGPVNIRVSITETSNPNQFTTALASAVESQRASILASVESRLRNQPDSSSAQAMRDAITKATDALAKYQEEYQEAVRVYQLYRTAQDDPSRQFYLSQYQGQKRLVSISEAQVEALYRSAGLSFQRPQPLP